jgi:hypothetical protein
MEGAQSYTLVTLGYKLKWRRLIMMEEMNVKGKMKDEWVLALETATTV